MHVVIEVLDQDKSIDICYAMLCFLVTLQRLSQIMYILKLIHVDGVYIEAEVHELPRAAI